MSTGLTPGTVVAGFRIESALGRGAMAQVYRAHDVQRDRVVALKLLDATLARDERFRQRFLRESQLAASLDHPHIVPTLGSGEEHGRLYLVMQLIDGSDLRQVLRNEGRIEPERAVGLVEQAAGALDAAHAAGLVHRDVKPGNILIAPTPEGEHAYVCDFGLARHVSSVSSLTGDRGFVGTIDYVPPEQIEGAPIDAKADVYSLGCVLFECITGERPFDRDSELSVVFAHLNEPPPRATDVRAELPAAFDEVFATALAKAPDDRYSSCGELAAAARAALHGEVLARRRPRRRLLAVVAVVAVLVAAAAVAAIVASSHGGATHVTITPTSIAGARLGDSNALIGQLWGGGLKLLMQTPADYSVLTQRTRNLSAYFEGTTDKAVEITTWDKADRTAQGIGPCSTLADLRRVYGKRLKNSPNSTHNGVVYGWTVGKRLFFAMEFVPKGTPNQVRSVAIYSNDLGSAGYNASNDGPCGLALNTVPVQRPAVIPVVPTLALGATLIARHFWPRLTVHTPRSWRVRIDTRREFTLLAPGGTTLDFRLDPHASSTSGTPLANVSSTAAGLSMWLRGDRAVAVSPPQTVRLGRQVITVTYLGVKPAAGSPARVPYLAFVGRGHPAPLAAGGARTVRVYLAPIRIDTLVHQLAVVIDAPSRQAFNAVLPTTDAIMRRFEVAAAAGPSLSALSSICTVPWQGTCLGELSAGTHSTRTFQPQLTYTVPLGWTNSGDMPGHVGLVPPGGDFNAINIGKSDYINVDTSIATAREGCADGPSKIHTPSAFARWLAHEPGLVTTKPAPVTVGGLSGVVIDIRMRKEWKKTCPWSQGVPAAQVLTGLDPSPGMLAHGMLPQPMVMRLYLLNYRHGTLDIEVDEVRGSSKLASYSRVVRTFRFKLR
jgi:tRNA A-37 threonylcarbamoyl transferase component Bud32